MKAVRVFWIAAALVAAAAWPSAVSADAGGVRASRRVVFYVDVGNLVPGPSYLRNLPRVRPTGVLMFDDGSWVLKKLRWSSWGGPVARATGISSASNCKPNCAKGKRTNHRIKFVVSHRRHLFGRTVYACYQLTDPKAPETDQHDCLKHAYGHQYVYTPVAESPLHLSDFLSPVGVKVEVGHELASARCSKETINIHGKMTVRFVLHGHVTCREARRTMRRYARAIVQGRCPTEICTQVTFPGGWTCSTAIPTQQGPHRPTWSCDRPRASFDVYKVRHHRRPGSPRHLSQFLSPDRKIWCVLDNGPGLREAYCGYDDNRSAPSQEYAAILHPNGKLVTCAWHPPQSGLRACVQNWNPSATVLRSGHVDVIYQYRCQATRAAITCTVDTGRGKGKGFTITDTGVTRVP